MRWNARAIVALHGSVPSRSLTHRRRLGVRSLFGRPRGCCFFFRLVDDGAELVGTGGAASVTRRRRSRTKEQRPMSRGAKTTEVAEPRWLLLIHQIPPHPGYLRIKVGRQLAKL